MSTTQLGMLYAEEAGADLSSSLHRFVTVNSSKKVVIASAGGTVLGTLYEAGASGRAVTVQLSGIGKCILAATLNSGARVASDGNGAAVAATGAAFEVGTLLRGGGAGDIVEYEISKGRAAA